MNTAEDQAGAGPRPFNYWRLWLLNVLLVCGGILFFLAAQYSTCEFFGMGLLMALLPFIPIVVLVGGGGSTIFVLSTVMVKKRSLKTPAALLVLLGPGLALAVLLVLLGAGKPAAHRLTYICLGNAPGSATHVQVTGYSTFLHEEWLAVFHVAPKEFQNLVAGAQMVPADTFEFRKMLDQSALKKTRLYQSLAQPADLPCFKRVFKEAEEHQRGGAYALFDPATSTAIVFRAYRD